MIQAFEKKRAMRPGAVMYGTTWLSEASAESTAGTSHVDTMIFFLEKKKSFNLISVILLTFQMDSQLSP